MSSFLIKATDLFTRERAYTFDDVLLVPCRSAVQSRFDVSVETQLTRRHKLKLPVVAANMDTVSESDMCIAMNEIGAAAILHRFMTIEKQVAEVKRVRENIKNGNGVVVASVGVNQDSKERARALVEAGAQVITLDIAHGHSETMIEMTKFIKNEFPEVDVIAGNVATAHGTEDLIRAGADSVKVGIGPGSMCTTRVITGVGMPQLSAVAVCVEVARKEGVPIIADGGIRRSGDAMKLICVGASSVMVGSLIAGCDETPGEIVNGKKAYQGMASRSAQISWRGGKLPEGMAPEGESTLVAAKGSVKDVVHEFVGGIRSGMSYLNASQFSDLAENAYFIEISSNCLRENVAHGLLN